MGLKDWYFWSSVPPSANMGWYWALLFLSFTFYAFYFLCDSFYALFLRHNLIFGQFIKSFSNSLSVTSSFSLHILRQGPREPEVTKPCLGLAIDQDIGGFNISMDHIGRMHELKIAEQIVKHDLQMFRRQSSVLRFIQ